MKKFNKFFTLILALLVAVSCLSLIGCQSEETDQEDTVVVEQAGEYYFKKITLSVSGMSITINRGDNYMGISFTKDYMKVTLNKDGSVILYTNGSNVNGTWSKISDSQIQLDDMTCFCDGTTLHIEIDGDLAILEK